MEDKEVIENYDDNSNSDKDSSGENKRLDDRINKLKDFISDEKELENFNKIGVIEQLISVIDEMSEFEIETRYEDETDLIDLDEIKENREDIIKKGLCTMKEIYKFLVKLGFNNEEINKWLDEIR